MSEEIIKKQFLLFEVDEEYAIDIIKVLEVIEYQPVTRVPETPDYIAGVINLRGRVIPVINMRTRFKKQAKEPTYKTCIVIVDMEGIHLGLVVDNVLDLISLEPGNIIDPPQVGKDYTYNFVKSIGMVDNTVKLILDGDRIINFTDIEFINEGEENI